MFHMTLLLLVIASTFARSIGKRIIWGPFSTTVWYMMGTTQFGSPKIVRMDPKLTFQTTRRTSAHTRQPTASRHWPSTWGLRNASGHHSRAHHGKRFYGSLHLYRRLELIKSVGKMPFFDAGDVRHGIGRRVRPTDEFRATPSLSRDTVIRVVYSVERFSILG